MDEKLLQAYLYDFYGELLNDHQRRIYEDFYFNDLSLGEIAAQEGTSRQAVADMARRTAGKLKGYEEKLHLVEKFLTVKANAQEILKLAEEMKLAADAAEGTMQPSADKMEGSMQPSANGMGAAIQPLAAGRTMQQAVQDDYDDAIIRSVDNISRLAQKIIEEL